MPTITIKNVSKKYDKNPLETFNFVSKEDEFVTILGPSGCGKSTLLKCVSGLERPDDGQIFISEKDVSKLAPGNRNMAMVFQSYALYPSLTVYQNISFPLKCQHMRSNEIREKVFSVSEKLEISGLLSKKPAHLSGGERQRVAIAKAIIRNPDVFLFDEPLANLDVNLKEKARHVFQQLHMHQTAVILYVTHDQAEAMALGDRVIVMNAGKIQQVDIPQKIYSDPANRFVAEFIGTPKINFVSKQVYSILAHDYANDVAQLEKIDLAIRPENIFISLSEKEHNATVRSVEILGRDAIVNVDIEGESLRICTSLSVALTLKTNDNIKCSAFRDNFLAFDKTTGARIKG